MRAATTTPHALRLLQLSALLWPLARHHVHAALLSHVSGVDELGRYVEAVALLVVHRLVELRVEDVQVAAEDVVSVVRRVGVSVVGRRWTILPLVDLSEACNTTERVSG